MRAFILAAFLNVLMVLPAGAAAELDATAQREAATKAEQAGDWDAALLHYENIYDSASTTPQEQVELRRKFAELHPKVKPNADPAKAGVYKARVYVFRSTQIGTVKHTYNDDQIKAINKATAAWADEVWKASLGNLRIVWDAVVIDKPLTKFAGYPDHVNCMPYFTDLKPGQVDYVAVYALTGGLPCNCWADTWGAVCKGAMYTGFNDGGDGGTAGDGEIQVHEWLHAVQMTLEWHQNYPVGLFPNPDSGAGNCGPDCWQPKPGQGSLYDWYRHILTTHVTRKMWRGLSLTVPTENAWIPDLNLCRKFLILGPFSTEGKDKDGLDFPYIDESAAAPLPDKKVGGTAWREASRIGRDLNFGILFFPSEKQAAYVAAVVQSPKTQPAQVRVGSNGSCKLWHNGKLVLTDAKRHGCDVDQNVVNIELQKGDNLFLMKAVNMGEDWAMNLRVTDSAGKPLPDVRYALPGEKPHVEKPR